jgi:hypothetical protein
MLSLSHLLESAHHVWGRPLYCSAPLRRSVWCEACRRLIIPMPIMERQSARKLQYVASLAISETCLTMVVVFLLVLTSTVLSLRLTSPQLSWDEADYALAAKGEWRTLPYTAPHGHGPLMLYLIKLSAAAPLGLTSIEDQSRLLLALTGAFTTGVTYWGLRHVFATSRLGALAGATLLMLSVIRIRETNIIGPHYPFLLWTVLVCVLTYRWRHTPTISAALVLGTVFGLAAATMVYCIPLALCWGVAMVAMRGKWFTYDRVQLQIPWMTLLLAGTAITVVSVLWPPSVRDLELLDSLRLYLEYAKRGHLTLVGDELQQKASGTAYVYWLWHLDAPILFFGLLGLAHSAYRTCRTWALPIKHRLLLAFIGVLGATALAAHIAGPRNFLLVIGGVCLFAGVTCDELIRHSQWRKVLCACLVITWPVLNLVAVQMREQEIPAFFWNGYQSFIEHNQWRLSQPNAAVIDGRPMVQFYAEHSGVSVQWKMSKMPWNPSDTPIPPDAKYALISELSYRYLPVEHPVRSVIDRTWTVVWSFKEPGTWGLRLYERQED